MEVLVSKELSHILITGLSQFSEHHYKPQELYVVFIVFPARNVDTILRLVREVLLQVVNDHSALERPTNPGKVLSIEDLLAVIVPQMHCVLSVQSRADQLVFVQTVDN